MSAAPRRAAALLCVALLLGCAYAAEQNPLKGEDLSIEKEREVTADVAAQIRSGLPLISDPVLLAYLNELGQEIVATTEPQPFIYRFALIDDDALNAFTIGGGYVYLNSGVLAQAGDVSELLGVIAHEVAHVRKRHIARRSEGQGIATLATLAALAAIALAGADPELLMVAQGMNVALQLQHSRTAEAEADREGIAYMIRAGYNPSGITRFFERLMAMYPDPGNIPAYLYTHPAVRERISATRVEIERVDPPGGLRRRDERLAQMQDRLARLVSPVAGGSGLHTRPEFDRALSDPLLKEARGEFAAGRLDEADLLLEHAAQQQPNDPRLPLLRADIAEERDDWAASVRHLQRVFELDPSLPLVLYRLGIAHERLGNRTQAVFYLEQSMAAFRPGSSAHKRAELEIQSITFPILEDAGLHGSGGNGDRRDFYLGEEITWWGELSRRFSAHNPEFSITWRNPGGVAVHRERVRQGPLGGISSRLDSRLAEPGIWTVDIVTGDKEVDSYTFRILDTDGS